MKKLSSDWFIEGLIDFEYKKYTLLSYLQAVGKDFAEVRLYPSFSDLIFHYKNLATFKEQKKQLINQFPEKLSEEDLAEMRLTYKPDFEEGANMKEIEAIIDYSIPAIKAQVREGKEIYDYIDQQIRIEPIGITPLYKQEGYLLLKTESRKDIDAFEYRIIFFENVEANYHGISLNHISSFRYSLTNTFESIKLQLIRSHGKYPNPATYMVYASHLFPRDSALLPVTKRKFLAYMK